MAVKYFRFEIGTMPDGSRVSYSPGWHGTSNHCPQNVVVDLYNDKEGYGIAHTVDTFIPKEATAITKLANDKVLADAVTLEAVKPQDGVYFGDKLIHRWDVKPEPIIDEKPIDVEPVVLDEGVEK